MRRGRPVPRSAQAGSSRSWPAVKAFVATRSFTTEMMRSQMWPGLGGPGWRHGLRTLRPLAGVPILWTRGTAIDGYLDGLDVGRAVPPKDMPAIAAAILDLARRGPEMRDAIAAAAPQLFATFDPVGVVTRYRADVDAAIGRDQS